VSLSPEQIVAEEFRLRARGYDRDEVDAFLDRLADQVEADAAHRQDLEQRLAALESDLAAAREREATLTRTLVTVQDAADRARADAEAEVATLRSATERELATIREQAQHEADQVREAAEAEAATLRATASEEATALRTAAADEASQLGARLREVQHLDAAHRDQLRAHLEGQLQALEALPDPYAELLDRVEPAQGEAAEEVAELTASLPVPSPTSPEADPATSPDADPVVADAAGETAEQVVAPAPPREADADPWRRSEGGEAADVPAAGVPKGADEGNAPHGDAHDPPGEGRDGDEPRDGGHDVPDAEPDGQGERPVEPDPPIWS
jgi:cell division initiation protein